MLTEDYKVRLDAFEGPLDLLLYLIRKAEVDIHNIPVAVVADQYMDFLRHIDRVDIDVAGEFLVMAATLTEIKSRMISPAAAPQTPDGSGDQAAPEDPRADLVRQLLAYKAYRDAADALEDRFDQWRSRFPNAPVTPNSTDPEVARLNAALAEQAADLDLEDFELIDLVEAFRKVMETVNFDRLGDHTVTYDDTPIEMHAEDILGVLRQSAASSPTPARVEFVSIFRGRTRSQMVGLFLALLVLVRDRKVSVAQDAIDGTISLGLQPPEATDQPENAIPTGPSA